MANQPLAGPEARHALAELNQGLQNPWALDDQVLHKSFRFPDFVGAFGFMAACALIAERLGHHPDWCNGYNRVDVRLTTHDAGGLTERDFRLARAMQGVAGPEG